MQAYTIPQEPTYEQLKDFYKNTVSKKYYLLYFVLAIFLGFFVTPILLAFMAILPNTSAGILLLWPIFVASTIYLIRRLHIKGLKSRYLFRQIAQQNNWSYTLKPGKENQNIDINRDLRLEMPMKLLGAPLVGTNGLISNTIGDQNFATYDYTYTTGSGKNRQTHHWSIATYKLNRPLPHILFDTKKNNFWKFSNLPNAFDRSQIISLESTLDQHFDFYSPEGYGVDTLSFITPEVLHYLVEKCTNFDIEVIEDQLYIYTKQKLNPKLFWEMHTVLFGLADHIHDNVDRYRDQRATVASSTGKARDAIAKPGLRLKRSIWPGILSGIGVIVIILLRFWLEASSLDPMGILTLAVIFGGFIAFAFVGIYRKKE